MKGFLSTCVRLNSRTEQKNYKQAMKTAKFKVDEAHNVYVKKKFGALVRNLDGRIQTVEDILTFRDEILGINPYEDIADMIRTGMYEFIIGPAAPSLNGLTYREYVGLYCKNYQQIVHLKREGILEI